MKSSPSPAVDGRGRVFSPPLPAPRNLSALLAGALAVALYVPALRNGFVWDDRAQVLANAWLESWRNVPVIFVSGVWDFEGVARTNYYRPLMHLTYLAVHGAFGPAPWAFHAVNVAANAAAAVLVTLLAQEVVAGGAGTRVSPPALGAGLLFASHPIHTEPVAWVAALPDVAATALGMAALLLHVRGIRRGGAPRAGVLAAAGALHGLALLYKETLLVLPVVALACDLVLDRGASVALRLRRLAPFVAAAVAYAGVRVAVLGAFAPEVAGSGASASGILSEAPALLGRYLAALIAPVRLSAWHELPRAGSWPSAWGLLGLGGALACALAFAWAYRRSAAATIGLVLASAALAPAFYTAAISGGRFAERYLYLPSCGAALVVAGALAAWERRGGARAGTVAVAVLAVAGSVATVARLPAWRDEVSLWADAARKYPRAATPRYNLGAALLEQGRAPEAAAELKAALSLGLEPVTRAAALVNLGRIDEATTGGRDAIRLYAEAVAADPRSASARANLGGALAERGRPGEALVHLREAARLRPAVADLRYNLGLVLADLGRAAEARAELEVAARLAPGDPRIAAALTSVRAMPAPPRAEER